MTVWISTMKRDHAKNISWNQLFSNFFSENVILIWVLGHIFTNRDSEIGVKHCKFSDGFAGTKHPFSKSINFSISQWNFFPAAWRLKQSLPITISREIAIIHQPQTSYLTREINFRHFEASKTAIHSVEISRLSMSYFQYSCDY